MQFYNSRADIFVPDGLDAQQALKRTTVMSIVAHQDDGEIMAYQAIADCFQNDAAWFTCVVLTEGGGSPRSGKYEHYTNDQISIKRSQEQRDAAVVGEYSAVLQLAYASEDVRDKKNGHIEEELASILDISQPSVVYTHNPFDRHSTHVKTLFRTLNAIRMLPIERRPRRFYGMEVWRSLDWLSQDCRMVFDTSKNPSIAQGVITAFESQCTEKKRFDLAIQGRRMANSTFSEPRDINHIDTCNIGMNLTPLIVDDDLDVLRFAMEHVDKFREEVKEFIIMLS